MVQKIEDVTNVPVRYKHGRIFENAKSDGRPYMYGAPVEFNARNLDVLFGKKDKRGYRRGK